MRIFTRGGKGQGTGILSPYLEQKRNLEVARLIEERSRILEVGCGSAGLLKTLDKLGKKPASYWGIDVLLEVIEDNRKRYPEHTFSCLDIQSDDIGQIHGVFDVIALIAVIEHIQQPEEALIRLKDELTPEGKMIITAPRLGGELLHTIGAKIGLFSQTALQEHNDRFPDYEDFVKLSELSGLKLILYKRFLWGFNQLVLLSR